MIKRVRSTPGGVDQYGDPVSSTTTETDIVGAFTAPRTSEDVDPRGRDGVIVGLTLFAPYGTDLVRTDRVKVDGTVYDIEGEVGAWKHPHTEWEAGITAALVRGEG